MKFIYACDVHGDKKKYEKLLEKAKESNIKYIVLGGDLLPKRGDRKIIQPEFIENYFEDYFKILKENDIDLIFIPGNDDLERFDVMLNELCDKYDNLHNINAQKLDIEDISFIGISDVLDHPFTSKNRVVIEKDLEMQPQLHDFVSIKKDTEMITVDEWKKYRETNIDKMEDILENLPMPTENKKAIYIFHNPPYGVGLDVCNGGEQVGSKAIVSFFENSKHGYMSFHGHIHESPRMSGKWQAQIGPVISIQPGQTEKDEKEMYYVMVDTENGEVERMVEEVR